MTKPTPTEEQRLTARAFCGVDQDDAWEEAVAHLLAEREAPQRERAEKAEREGAKALDRAEKAEAKIDAAFIEARDATRDVLLLRLDRDHARANLATVQREHDELRRSTEAARAAIAQALGLTEWRALADLAAEVARLTAERDRWASRHADAETAAYVAEARADVARAGLAASRAEVEALRAEVAIEDRRHREAVSNGAAAARDAEAFLALLNEAHSELCSLVNYDAGLNYGGHYNVDDANVLAGKIAAVLVSRAALSSTPAPFNVDATDEAVAASRAEVDDALTKSTEAARVAIAKALGLTEWTSLADLAAEVARLTAERDRWASRHADAETAAYVAEARADVARAGLAASRAEVEALRADVAPVVEALGPCDHIDHHGNCQTHFVERPCRVHALAVSLAALSSTPAPASAEPSTRPTRPAGLPPTETVFGVLMARSQQIKAGVDASAEPATPTREDEEAFWRETDPTFAGRQMCNMTNCGGSVEMYWTAAYSKQGKCSRCNCAVQCSTTEAGPLATPTTEGGAK